MTSQLHHVKAEFFKVLAHPLRLAILDTCRRPRMETYLVAAPFVVAVAQAVWALLARPPLALLPWTRGGSDALLLVVNGTLIPWFPLSLLERLDVSHEIESYLPVAPSLLASGLLVALAESLIAPALQHPMVRDRLRYLGVVSLGQAHSLALVGPAARAGGIGRDLRSDEASYRPFTSVTRQGGGVLARAHL